MAIKKTINNPDPGRLSDSLRDTGYTFNTALADIIDNSIDADAYEIDVGMVMDEDGEIEIWVADNGKGMNHNELVDAMKYGSQHDADQEHRLGKFGLGMKTASTAFSKKLIVVTRSNWDNETRKTWWDLDHIDTVKEWEQLWDDPGPEDLRLLHETAANGTGTVVRWDSVDRLIKNYQEPGGRFAQSAFDKIRDDLVTHLAMIYHRYIDSEDDRARTITITVNGERVEPWDPFCTKTGDSELVGQVEPKVEFSNGEEGSFQFNTFILKHTDDFSSEDNWDKAKVNNDNQGVYVYRKNRMILPHDWLYMYTKDFHLSLLRAELSFESDLDPAFDVDIKKNRIVLNPALRESLQKMLTSPRNRANKIYRRGQNSGTKTDGTDPHRGSKRNIDDKGPKVSRSKIEITDLEKNEVQVTNKSGQSKRIIKIVVPENKNDTILIDPVDQLEDGLLWEPALLSVQTQKGSNHAVSINTSHPYYQKVYVPNHDSTVTVSGLDSLMWALAEAEHSMFNEESKRFIGDLKYEVSRILKTLVEDLPDPVSDFEVDTSSNVEMSDSGESLKSEE